jgi:hypothetical protein
VDASTEGAVLDVFDVLELLEPAGVEAVLSLEKEPASEELLVDVPVKVEGVKEL